MKINALAPFTVPLCDFVPRLVEFFVLFQLVSIIFALPLFLCGSKETVDNPTAMLSTDGYDTLSGPRTTGDGFYESCVKGLEEILQEIIV